jgi:hypothetical protein
MKSRSVPSGDQGQGFSPVFGEGVSSFDLSLKMARNPMDVIHYRFGIAKHVAIDPLEDIGPGSGGVLAGDPIGVVNMPAPERLYPLRGGFH